MANNERPISLVEKQLNRRELLKAAGIGAVLATAGGAYGAGKLIGHLMEQFSGQEAEIADLEAELKRLQAKPFEGIPLGRELSRNGDFSRMTSVGEIKGSNIRYLRSPEGWFAYPDYSRASSLNTDGHEGKGFVAVKQGNRAGSEYWSNSVPIGIFPNSKYLISLHAIGDPDIRLQYIDERGVTLQGPDITRIEPLKSSGEWTQYAVLFGNNGEFLNKPPSDARFMRMKLGAGLGEVISPDGLTKYSGVSMREILPTEPNVPRGNGGSPIQS